MIRRRTRIITLILVVAFVHTICFRILKYESKSIFGVNLFGLRQYLNDEAVEHKSKQDEFYNIAKESMGNNNVENENQDNKNSRNQYLLDLNNRKEYSKITLDRYLIDNTKHEVPQVQKFDPRFTFGILFDNLTKSITQQESINNLEFPYFHWADWTDLSNLDDHFYSNNKESCKVFDLTNNNPKNKKNGLEFLKPETFCFDDQDINNIIKKDISEEMKSYLEIVKRSPISTGFHVFQYPGRSSSKLKSLAAKSYLNDFMPPPFSVSFLLPQNSKYSIAKKEILKVNISQEASHRKRLIHTDMISEFTESRNNYEDKITLDVSSGLELLSNAVKGRRSNIERLSFSKVLDETQFFEKSEEIMNDLSNKEVLGFMDGRYLDSLSYSKAIKSPPKYFYEARLQKKEKGGNLGAHYDWRFFNGIINNSDKQAPSLFGLIKAWLAFTNANDFDTWLAHGTLLSWYWSGMSFPWDNDIDVQMPIDQLHRLAREFNQSIIIDLGNGNGEELRYGRYFLDVSSFIDRRIKGNGNNNIDARFVDMDTGLYIDITGLALSDTRGPIRYQNPEDLKSKDMALGEKTRNKNMQIYNCKNNHFARLTELSPLKLTYYEGEIAYIPNSFQQLLINEYGEKGIEEEVFKEYTFLKKLRIWVSRRIVNKFKHNKKKENREKFANISVDDFSDEDYATLLKNNEELLIEYMLTSNLTSFHEDEIYKLTKNQDTSSLFQDSHETLSSSLRHDSFTFNFLDKGYAFEDQISKTLEAENELKNRK